MLRTRSDAIPDFPSQTIILSLSLSPALQLDERYISSVRRRKAALSAGDRLPRPTRSWNSGTPTTQYLRSKCVIADDTSARYDSSRSRALCDEPSFIGGGLCSAMVPAPPYACLVSSGRLYL